MATMEVVVTEAGVVVAVRAEAGEGAVVALSESA